MKVGGFESPILSQNADTDHNSPKQKGSNKATAHNDGGGETSQSPHSKPFRFFVHEWHSSPAEVQSVFLSQKPSGQRDVILTSSSQEADLIKCLDNIKGANTYQVSDVFERKS